MNGLGLAGAGGDQDHVPGLQDGPIPARQWVGTASRLSSKKPALSILVCRVSVLMRVREANDEPGIGTDGHIGFNEPGSSLASRTRIKTLTRQTRIDNARFFDGNLDAVPTHCLTQGLGTILSARHVVLVATGSGQGRGRHHLVEGLGQRAVAGTILQHHPHATVLLDGAPRAGCSSPTTTGRPTRPSRPGRASEANRS